VSLCVRVKLRQLGYSQLTVPM